MKKFCFMILMLLLFSSKAWAYDVIFDGATRHFIYNLCYTTGSCLPGAVLNTDYNLKISCAQGSVISLTGTPEDEGGGRYNIDTSTSIPNYVFFRNCRLWTEGIGDLAFGIDSSSLPITPKPRFDASICQITAATSSTSFTLSNCVDRNGSSITLPSHKWVAHYLIGVNRGSTQCNVIDEGVYIGTLTSGGVVTVKTSDMPNSDFSVTPSITNCNVIVAPSH